MSELAKAESVRTYSLRKNLFTKGVLTALWLATAYLAVQIVDNIGFGYSPAFDDGIGWLLNLSCCAIWLGGIVLALGLVLWRHRHLGYFLSLLTVSFSSFVAYPYFAALDAASSITIVLSTIEYPTQIDALPEIWPWPTHVSREISNQDLNFDGRSEKLLFDEYRIQGSVNERIIHLQVLQSMEEGYLLLLSQQVDEGRVYAFEQGCQVGPSHSLGYHSSIWLMNYDVDRDIEIYVHQAISRIPPDCRFDYFFDWKDNQLEGSIPNPIWLWLHALFPYSLALMMIGFDYLNKPFWLATIIALFVIWSIWEIWLGSHSWLWLAVGLGFVLVILIGKFWARKTSHLPKSFFLSIFPASQIW